jgi:hypothetical protein
VSRRAEPAPQAPASGGASSSLDYFGAGTFDDDQLGGGGGPTIDLGHGGTPAHRGGEIASFDALSDDLELGSHAGGNSALAMDPVPRGPAVGVRVDNYPTGKSPERETLRIDDVDVKLLADYGEAPKAVWLAPLYSYRVLTRQRLLKQKIVELDAGLERAERARDEALGQAALLVRAALEGDNRFERLVAPIREFEGLAAERSAALDAAQADHGAKLGEFDTQRAGAQAQIDSVRAVEAEQVKAHTVLEQHERRLNARVQRLQIEVRNVLDAAQRLAGPTGENVSGEHAQKLAALRADLAPAEAELDKARREADTARAALERTRREISGLEKKKTELERQKQSLAKQHEKHVNVRAQGVADAETNRRKALADVGRAVLEMQGEIPIEPKTLDSLRTLDASVAKALKEHEKHVRALDVFDPAVLKLGYKVAAGGGLLLLALVVLKILL